MALHDRRPGRHPPGLGESHVHHRKPPSLAADERAAPCGVAHTRDCRRGASRRCAAARRHLARRSRARPRHGHGDASGDAADRVADDDRKHHRQAGRADDQRDRCRRFAQVPAEPVGAQALHRRLRPRRPGDARLGHRQQRAIAGLRRRHPALEPARQRRDLRAALGHGDAGRDRARRRSLRALLGGLFGQLGRRHRRFRDADAEPIRGPRQGSGLQPELPALRHRPALLRRRRQRVDRQPRRRVRLVDRRQLPEQQRPAGGLRRQERAGADESRRDSGDRRLPRPLAEGSARLHLRHDDADACDRGPREAQARLRPDADAARDLHRRRLAQRIRSRRRFVPARPGRQCRDERPGAGRRQHRRPPLHRPADRLRAHQDVDDARHAGPQCQEQHLCHLGLGRSGEPVRLRPRHRPLAGAERRRRRSRPHHRPARQRLEHAGAEGHLAATGCGGRAHRRVRRPARRLQDADGGVGHGRLGKRRAGRVLFRVHRDGPRSPVSGARMPGASHPHGRPSSAPASSTGARTTARLPTR